MAESNQTNSAAHSEPSFAELFEASLKQGEMVKEG